MRTKTPASDVIAALIGWRQLLLEGSDSYNSRFLGDAVDGDDRRRRSCHQTSLATAMISPQQYRKLMKQFQLENHIGHSAIKAGIDPNVPRLGFSWERGRFSGALFRRNWHVGYGVI